VRLLGDDEPILKKRSGSMQQMGEALLKGGVSEFLTENEFLEDTRYRLGNVVLYCACVVQLSC
jgi:hypothetical protein